MTDFQAHEGMCILHNDIRRRLWGKNRTLLDANVAFLHFKLGYDIRPAWTYVHIFGDGLGCSVRASVIEVGGGRKSRGLGASNHIGDNLELREIRTNDEMHVRRHHSNVV